VALTLPEPPAEMLTSILVARWRIPNKQGGKLMLTAIAIAILVGVAASAVTATFFQAKVVGLVHQIKDLVVQMGDEKAKAQEIISKLEKDVESWKDRSHRHLKDWSELYQEKREWTEALEKAAEAKAAKKANKTSKNPVKKANKK